MNAEDYETLYDALHRSVYSFAARRIGSIGAQDLVSETFEVVWRRRDDAPTERGTWPGWVVGIAKNKLLQELVRRQRKHHDGRFSEDWVGEKNEPRIEDIARGISDADVATRVYGRLSPAEKLLFDVAFIRGLTVTDSARLLGISDTAFTTRVMRLRQRLTDLYDEENDAFSENSGREVN